MPHMQALFTFACRLCRDNEDAADLMQDTYLKAFRSWDSFQSGSNCKAWMFRILKNSFINNYRRKQASPEMVDYDTVEDFIESVRDSALESTDLERSIFDNTFDDEVTHAIETLPEEFRTAVLLCDVEGFSYADISLIMDSPVGTVRSRIHRGRGMLARNLANYALSRGYGSKQFQQGAI